MLPTPLPLTYANVRFWRAYSTAESQYSVPVRSTDGDAVYDNQDTLNRLQLQRRRCGHVDVGVTTAAGNGRLKQASGTSNVGDGRIMRFVELRQVRAVSDHEEDLSEDAGRQRGFRPYATEDRYLVAPAVAERSTPSHHLYYLRANKPEAVYVNVEDAPPSWRTSAGQQTPSDPLLEEDVECNAGPEATTAQGEHASESCIVDAELSHEEEQLDDDSGASRSVMNPDFCENAVQKTKDDELQKTGSEIHIKSETSDDSPTRRERSRSRQKTPTDTTRARPPAQFRLEDAYLLRMSPPPPSHQADGRRRAAYSDPVRWVSPVSTDRQRQQAEMATSPSSLPTTRQGPSGRPSGFRSHAGSESSSGVARTAAMTCTNEALDEAIRRRNRKCKPSAMRRLQAAKAIGGGEPETTGELSSFEPIFEGVTCSLRTRSASLSDCNALAKEHGHTLSF